MRFKEFLKEQFLTSKYEISNWLTGVAGVFNPKFEMKGDLVCVANSMGLSGLGLTKLPFKFDYVTGNFMISSNKLTTLEGCPRIVRKDFDCTFNDLTSLGGCPREMGSLHCEGNDIRSLVGINEMIDRIAWVMSADFNKIERGGIGLLLIEGLALIRSTPGSMPPPFVIIEKYIGKLDTADKLYECQAELIENGFEAFAEL